jgi:hypothetical protein
MPDFSKTNGQRHLATLPHVDAAIRALHAAVKEQHGLEWTSILEGFADDISVVRVRIAAYAEAARRQEDAQRTAS